MEARVNRCSIVKFITVKDISKLRHVLIFLNMLPCCINYRQNALFIYFIFIFSVVVKKGNPKSDELEQMANDIDPSDWKKVARKLKIHDPKITAIHKENEEFYEKIYQMLLKWKEANGSAATWKKLYKALIDADLKELAEKHCCKKTN